MNLRRVCSILALFDSRFAQYRAILRFVAYVRLFPDQSTQDRLRRFINNARSCARHDGFHLTSLPSLSSIHPRLLSVHSPIPFCITPKGRSPRLFPLQAPSASVCSLCSTSRLLLLLVALPLLFLLLRPPSSSIFGPHSTASVFVPPATLGISSPRNAFLLLPPLLLACCSSLVSSFSRTWFSRSFCFR